MIADIDKSLNNKNTYTERPAPIRYRRSRFRNNLVQVDLTFYSHQEEKRPVKFVAHAILQFTTINVKIE